MKDFLEESGYNILVARDGGEALAITAQTIPDAIVLDLMMPGIDGFRVLKTLRDNESTALVPVLILTAKQITKEELKFLKRNNIHQLIQKGDVSRSELLQAVARMLSPQTEETPKPPRGLQIIEGKPLVLVVEDNPDNMTTAKAILSENFTVLEATDGKTAIELAKQYFPNLILMDIDIPVMNGIEAFKAIRGNARLLHIPIIALTASAMVADRETILAYGFDGYIVKPIDETIFFRVIHETLYGK
jgi:CheY-like chemotaxis protein